MTSADRLSPCSCPSSLSSRGSLSLQDRTGEQRDSVLRPSMERAQAPRVSDHSSAVGSADESSHEPRQPATFCSAKVREVKIEGVRPDTDGSADRLSAHLLLRAVRSVHDLCRCVCERDVARSLKFRCVRLPPPCAHCSDSHSSSPSQPASSYEEMSARAHLVRRDTAVRAAPPSTRRTIWSRCSRSSELDAEAALGNVTRSGGCGSAEGFEASGDVDGAAPFAALDAVDG